MVRVDYYIIRKWNMSLYTSPRFAYNNYIMTSTYLPVNPGYNTTLSVLPSKISFQAHFGFSYYFYDVIGLNAELGIGYGGPYILAVGITAKIL